MASGGHVGMGGAGGAGEGLSWVGGSWAQQRLVGVEDGILAVVF